MRIKIYRSIQNATAYLVLPVSDPIDVPKTVLSQFGQRIEPPLYETIHAWGRSGRIDVKAAYRAIKRYGYFMGNVRLTPGSPFDGTGTA